MNTLADGAYLTRPLHSTPNSPSRLVVVENQTVYLNGFTFTVHDFFKFNVIHQNEN